jgi:hypothetical protein
MLGLMDKRQNDAMESQAPFCNGYYILKITYEHQNADISSTAILLLPWSEVSTWNYYSLYVVGHLGPMQSKAERYTIIGKESEWRISSMINHISSIEYLMSATGERIILQAENVLAFNWVVYETKPLFDEYAILHTAMPNTNTLLMDKRNFGTYADQVLDALERQVGGDGFHWRDKEAAQDPTVSDTPLKLKSKTEKKDDMETPNLNRRG